MTRTFILAAIILFGAYRSWAQSPVLDGRIVDGKRNVPLGGVHIRLTLQSDTSKKFFTSTDNSGLFVFDKIGKGDYAFEATYVGYITLKKSLTAGGPDIHLGTLQMEQTSIQDAVRGGEVDDCVEGSEVFRSECGAGRRPRSPSLRRARPHPLPDGARRREPDQYHGTRD